MSDIISYKEVEEKVLNINGQNILLDRDVAELYGVETKEINQAVKNNPNKFLEGYVITLNVQEKDELVKNFDRINTVKALENDKNRRERLRVRTGRPRSQLSLFCIFKVENFDLKD